MKPLANCESLVFFSMGYYFHTFCVTCYSYPLCWFQFCRLHGLRCTHRFFTCLATIDWGQMQLNVLFWCIMIPRSRHFMSFFGVSLLFFFLSHCPHTYTLAALAINGRSNFSLLCSRNSWICLWLLWIK